MQFIFVCDILRPFAISIAGSIAVRYISVNDL